MLVAVLYSDSWLCKGDVAGWTCYRKKTNYFLISPKIQHRVGVHKDVLSLYRECSIVTKYQLKGQWHKIFSTFLI